MPPSAIVSQGTQRHVARLIVAARVGVAQQKIEHRLGAGTSARHRSHQASSRMSGEARKSRGRADVLSRACLTLGALVESAWRRCSRTSRPEDSMRVAVGKPGLGEVLQQGGEAGAAVAIVGREIGAAEERLPVGREKHGHGPAAATRWWPARTSCRCGRCRAALRGRP